MTALVLLAALAIVLGLGRALRRRPLTVSRHWVATHEDTHGDD
jgi:hypothetical protein